MTPESDAELIDRASRWVADDPDLGDRQELQALIAAATTGDGDAAEALADLAARMDGDLQFGTAGLRAAMGAGSARMNTAVVTRAAWAIAGWLHERTGSAGMRPQVVIGFDARHRSAEFAATSAAVIAAGGCWPTLLDRPLPTPVLAHAVRAGAVDAGIMVTASHNPAADNGYKVYLGNLAEPGDGRGSQLVSPADAEIAARIAQAPPAGEVPVGARGWHVVPGDSPEHPLVAYLASIAALAARVSGPTGSASQADSPDSPGFTAAAPLRFVVTAMHGVGAPVLVDAFAAAGLAAPILVPEQAEADPDFPTVAFPNPEEPGALDLALTLARDQHADLVIALDPDADRCCVAVPDGSADGGWRVLTGDQLGAVLGSAVLDTVAPERISDAVVASSIVSGDLLWALAMARGATAVRTLTGFKWLSRVPGLTFAYEEALGYCCDPDAVHDKDGISAAVVVALTARRLAAEGRTLLDLLDDLERAHGVHLTAPVTLRLSSAAEAAARLSALRAHPPTELDGVPVTSVEDLTAGGDLPPTDALVLRTDGGGRVVLRPSGTEPKLKCYLQVVRPVTDSGQGHGDGDLAATRAEAGALLHRLQEAVTALVGG